LKINSLKRGGVKINSDFQPNLREYENELKVNSLKRGGVKINSGVKIDSDFTRICVSVKIN